MISKKYSLMIVPEYLVNMNKNHFTLSHTNTAELNPGLDLFGKASVIGYVFALASLGLAELRSCQEGSHRFKLHNFTCPVGGTGAF